MANLKHKISISIATELKRRGDAIFIKKISRLFKNEVSLYGVSIKKVKEIIKNFYQNTPVLKDRKICINVADELIKTKIFENQIAGTFLFEKLVKKNEFKDISYLKRLFKYIKNWAVCDTISTEVLAEIIRKNPLKISIFFKWNKSKNIWLRRALLVTVIKLKNDLKEWDTITKELLSCFKNEKEDIVKKAINWLKKERG